MSTELHGAKPPAPEVTPMGMVEDMLFMAIMPAQIQALETAVQHLEHNNWQEAVEVGLLSTLDGISSHLHNPKVVDAAITPHSANKLQGAQEFCQDTINAYHMSERLMAENHIERTPADTREALHILRMNIDNLLHILREGGEVTAVELEKAA